MLPVYSTAVSGLQASQSAMDTIANNIANSATPGFDASDPTLSDLVYQSIDPRMLVTTSPSQMVEGAGARIDIAPRSLQPGLPMVTGNPLDVAISGDGYLQIIQADGSTGYTRAGMIRPDANGKLSINGLSLQPPITIPTGGADVTIANNGVVAAMVNGQPQNIGQIELARFINPQGLLATNATTFTATADSGAPITGTPAIGGFGGAQAGMLESARVDLGQQMSLLIFAERAYGLDSKALQTIDAMIGVVTKQR